MSTIITNINVDSTQSNMSNLTFSPSPADYEERKPLRLVYTITYLGALRRGDVLLCIPGDVRQRIFSYVLTDYSELHYIEVPDTQDFIIPRFMSVGKLWYAEASRVMIQNATISISSDAAIFNLMVVLKHFGKHLAQYEKRMDEVQVDEYRSVRSLEFTSLDLFEKGEFSSNATKLLRQCTNLRSITLIINLKDLIWMYGRGGRELDLDIMTRKYDFEAITKLPRLEVIDVQLHPCMSLQKSLMRMEEERKEAERSGTILPGVDGFWGMKEWLEIQGLDQMRLIEVKCPKVDRDRYIQL